MDDRDLSTLPSLVRSFLVNWALPRLHIFSFSFTTLAPNCSDLGDVAGDWYKWLERVSFFSSYLEQLEVSGEPVDSPLLHIFS